MSGLASTEERQEWLGSLKPGDSVAVSSRDNVVRLEKVKKVTPTGVIVVAFYKGELRFNKFGQHRTSDPWHHRHIAPVTPDVCDKVHRQSLLKKIGAAKFSKLKTYTLIEIVVLIEKDQASPASKVPA